MALAPLVIDASRSVFLNALKLQHPRPACSLLFPRHLHRSGGGKFPMLNASLRGIQPHLRAAVEDSPQYASTRAFVGDP
jgi:hypothetical protein